MKPVQILSLGLVALLVSLQYRLWIGEGSLAHASNLKDQVDVMAAGNGSMRQRNVILKAEIMDLKEGLDAIEEKARSEYGLIKRNETFFLLVEE